MQSEVQYEQNDRDDKRDICDILYIQKFYSNKDIVMVYAEQIEQEEYGYWEIGNIQIKQQVIKENFSVFLDINISDKILFTNGQIAFLAEVIELFNDGFRIKKCMPILELEDLSEDLQAEIEYAIGKNKALSVICNKEEVYNLLNGLVLVDDQLHINIHTEAEYYYFDDLTDLLLGIREILGFENSLDSYIKIKLCSPGFIILTITAGIEFVTNNAVGIVLLMCIIFGGEITIGGNTVSPPSIAKGICYLVNAKQNRQANSVKREYEEEQLKGKKLDNIKKENDIAIQKRDIEKINKNVAKLKDIRDKMKIKKGKGTKAYIKVLDEVIGELEKIYNIP